MNRYPDDPYDRIWFPYVDVTRWAEISTDMQVATGNVYFEPPFAVMQTAIRPRNVSENIKFTLELQSNFPRDLWLGYIDSLHFAELQRLPSDALREFNINNGALNYRKAYRPDYLSIFTIYSQEPTQFGSEYTMSLDATANSTLPPIINAIEIFSVISTALVGTDSQDGAIMIYLSDA